MEVVGGVVLILLFFCLVEEAYVFCCELRMVGGRAWQGVLLVLFVAVCCLPRICHRDSTIEARSFLHVGGCCWCCLDFRRSGVLLKKLFVFSGELWILVFVCRFPSGGVVLVPSPTARVISARARGNGAGSRGGGG